MAQKGVSGRSRASGGVASPQPWYDTFIPGAGGPGSAGGFRQQGTKLIEFETPDFFGAQLQKDLQAKQLEGEKYRAQLQYNASTLPEQLKQQRFNELFPFLQGQLGQAFGGDMATPGGQSPPGPTFDTNPIWGTGQIQQQLSASQARNDRAMGGLGRRTNAQLAVRGYSPGSALAQQLGGQRFAQNLATNTANRRQMNFELAQANKQYQQQGRQLQEQQAARLGEQDIERRKPYFANMNALIQSLSSLV